MSPRILAVDRCPHCKSPLEKPTPRVCPACGGSLQKRFLTAGCLSSAPPIVLAAWGLWHVVEQLVARALQS
jgi:predicted amidophosphoribosyltransferase